MMNGVKAQRRSGTMAQKRNGLVKQLVENKVYPINLG